MRKVTLTRKETSDAGTFGELVTDSGFNCVTGELPWRDNVPDESCIPPGVYLVTWRFSPKHADCYHIENVPGRTAIEIHAANFMGDKKKGLRCDLLGCIAPGFNIGKLLRQKAILGSHEALVMLEEILGRETFELTII